MNQGTNIHTISNATARDELGVEREQRAYDRACLRPSVMRALRDVGVSVADLAELHDLSTGRVYQLLDTHKQHRLPYEWETGADLDVIDVLALRRHQATLHALWPVCK